METYIAGQPIDLAEFDVSQTIAVFVKFRIINEASPETPVFYKVSWSDTPLVVSDPTYIEIDNGGETYPIEKNIFSETYDILGDDICVNKSAIVFYKPLFTPVMVQSLEDNTPQLAPEGNILVLDKKGNPYVMSASSFIARYQKIPYLSGDLAIDDLSDFVNTFTKSEARDKLEEALRVYNGDSNEKNMRILYARASILINSSK